MMDDSSALGPVPPQPQPGDTPPSSSRSSPTTTFVQLHPKNRPTGLGKRSLEQLEDWDNHQTYMHVKQRKLQDQFQNMGVAKKSNIFDGVTIYVNGWTQPKADELKEMMHAHGGRYVYNIYSRSTITHTIASNLPNSKILKLGSSLVCKPSWIVDSIAAEKLLPVEDYLLYKPKGGQNRLRLSRKSKTEPEEEVAFTPDSSPSISHQHENEMCIVEHGHDMRSEMSPGDFQEAVGDGSDSPIATEGEMLQAPLGHAAHGADLESLKKVSEFFAHSRLHYLSTWSTELKQFTAERLKEITPKLQRLPSSASLRGLRTRAVVHIDLDCFFVSVSLRDKPYLRGKPVAVTHAKRNQQQSNSSKPMDSNLQANISEDSAEFGSLDKPERSAHQLPVDSTSDIASCSYEAREAGVRNGMLVGKAMKKCPDLILLPYDFKSYRKVSQILYETLLHYSSVVEAVSCDEAYLELTDFCRDSDHILEVVRELRNEVQSKTGCTVSAGISYNMLLARMSTRVAKPDGQFFLSAKDTLSFLASQPVRDLPGVGYAMAIKLREMQIESCADLKAVSLERLQSTFGAKTGKMLHDYARGIDARELRISAGERKSISVDMNFGIRFKSFSEAESLVRSLAEELQKRAEQAQVVGNQLTLKTKIRKKDAPLEPKKFQGHGPCDNVSKSVILLTPSREATECSSMAIRLLKQLNPVVTDIRGMGLQLGKLAGGGCGVGGRDVDRGGSKAGRDLRKILAAKEENTSTSEVQAAPSESPEKKSDSALLSISNKLQISTSTGQQVQKTLSNSRGSKKLSRTASTKTKSPRKSPHKSPSAKSRAKATNTGAPSKTLKHFFGSSSSISPSKPSIEDSFSIELPPVSQLNHSVLEALPAHMCEKILQTYTKRGDTVSLRSVKKEGTLMAEYLTDIGKTGATGGYSEGPEAHTATETSVVTAAVEEEIVIKDEESFLSSWKEYVTDWLSEEGPVLEEDIMNIADYLRRLAKSNLEMTALCLKSLRRLVQLHVGGDSGGCGDALSWRSAFNKILKRVQERVREVYGGILQMEQL